LSERIRVALMEVPGVVLVHIIRSEIRPAPEPAGLAALEIAVVHVHGGDVRILGVEDQRDAGRIELEAVSAREGFRELGREFSVNFTEVHAALLEELAALAVDPRDPASAAFAGPAVFVEGGTIQAGHFIGDPRLEVQHEATNLGTHYT